MNRRPEREYLHSHMQAGKGCESSVKAEEKDVRTRLVSPPVSAQKPVRLKPSTLDPKTLTPDPRPETLDPKSLGSKL